MPTDPFEQLGADCGLRILVERISLAPRDLAALPDEAERCYLITLTAPEGRTAARLAFIRALQDPEPPGLRDTLWWLASDAWAVERSGGDVARWATIHRLTPTDPIVAREFEHYSAQTRSLALVLGADVYRQLLTAYEASGIRTGSPAESIAEPRGPQQQRP